MIARLFLMAGISAAALAGEVTFSRDVAPILYKRCVACHHPGDIAPMSLLTYKDARPWAAAIKEAILSRKMPPWKADPHYGKWANDPSLTTRRVAHHYRLGRWRQGGGRSQADAGAA